MQIMIKFTCSNFKSSNNFFITFFTYSKISKDSSAKYYQSNRKRLKKILVKDIKVFLKKKKKRKIWP